MTGELILPKDTEVLRPEFILLEASAGTGKTHALTLRFAQFLLSDKIRNNQLNQILAITFTHNAANEMKDRIIGWLKATYFGQDAARLKDIKELVSLPEEAFPERAEEKLQYLFDHYSDFQVTTIDSFMTDVFKASAIEMGFSPDFEITLNTAPVINYAFYRYLRNITAESEDGQLLLRITDSLKEMKGSDKAFLWNPADEILETFTQFYRKLEALYRQPEIKRPEEFQLGLEKAEGDWQGSLQKLRQLLKNTPLERAERSAIWRRLNSDNIRDWFDCSFKTDPVKKTESPDLQAIYQEVIKCLDDFKEKLKKYKRLYAASYFQPHLQVYHRLLDHLDFIKKEKGLIFLDDVNRHLAAYLQTGVVPDIYLCLGGQIYHFLIDEFQDTSPIQWKNLVPLIDNALSQGGSLFIVGDTKQAIYGFREADYQIMVDLKKGDEKFYSVEVCVKPLVTNRRSRQAILDFVSSIFPRGIREMSVGKDNQKMTEKIDNWKKAANSSGLDNFECQGVDDKTRGGGDIFPGYVEMEFFQPPRKSKNKDEQAEDNGQEFRSGTEAEEEVEQEDSALKKRVQELIADLQERGYGYSDITILAYKNETVVRAASWLNEKQIPFITFSSLDIRQRPIIKEILALLQFLDFPLDNLNFSIFLLGNLFKNKLKADGHSEQERGQLIEFILDSRLRSGQKDYPLYTYFKQEYQDLWESYFEPLYRTVGYLPLYDLVSDIYRTFSVFDPELTGDEQSALIKLLEVIKQFEGQGGSNLRDFIRFSGEEIEDNSVWTVDVPESIKAVRIMTIHKAKGLESPVVILPLYTEHSPSIPFFLQPEESSQGAVKVKVLKLSRDIISDDEELNGIYEETSRKELANRLNTFYVALTRAKEELYILGQRGHRKYFPFDFLESLGFSLEKKFQSAEKKPVRKARPMTDSRPSEPEIPYSPLNFLPEAQDRFRLVKHLPHYRQERRGELIHAILEKIDFLEENLEEQLEKIISGRAFRKYQPEEKEEARKSVLQFLKQPEVAEFFRRRPGREVRTEVEMVNRRGELYRTDRLLIEPKGISIIDFKTGQFPDEAVKKGHTEQVKNYKTILEEIYPGRKISGWLLYIDSAEREEVL
ncbi:MAG TPA: UvrD-helicase domain-containing protein [Candidatus Saccharicenans sp.]|nr:UvrD-helicase domain-containing protein [Candidatus Saccharicenans sp.]